MPLNIAQDKFPASKFNGNVKDTHVSGALNMGVLNIPLGTGNFQSTPIRGVYVMDSRFFSQDDKDFSDS